MNTFDMNEFGMPKTGMDVVREEMFRGAEVKSAAVVAPAVAVKPLTGRVMDSAQEMVGGEQAVTRWRVQGLRSLVLHDKNDVYKDDVAQHPDLRYLAADRVRADKAGFNMLLGGELSRVVGKGDTYGALQATIGALPEEEQLGAKGRMQKCETEYQAKELLGELWSGLVHADYEQQMAEVEKKRDEQKAAQAELQGVLENDWLQAVMEGHEDIPWQVRNVDNMERAGLSAEYIEGLRATHHRAKDAFAKLVYWLYGDTYGQVKANMAARGRELKKDWEESAHWAWTKKPSDEDFAQQGAADLSESFDLSREHMAELIKLLSDESGQLDENAVALFFGAVEKESKGAQTLIDSKFWRNFGEALGDFGRESADFLDRELTRQKSTGWVVTGGLLPMPVSDGEQAEAQRRMAEEFTGDVEVLKGNLTRFNQLRVQADDRAGLLTDILTEGGTVTGASVPMLAVNTLIPGFGGVVAGAATMYPSLTNEAIARNYAAGVKNPVGMAYVEGAWQAAAEGLFAATLCKVPGVSKVGDWFGLKSAAVPGVGKALGAIQGNAALRIGTGIAMESVGELVVEEAVAETGTFLTVEGLRRLGVDFAEQEWKPFEVAWQTMQDAGQTGATVAYCAALGLLGVPANVRAARDFAGSRKMLLQAGLTEAGVAEVQHSLTEYRGRVHVALLGAGEKLRALRAEAEQKAVAEAEAKAGRPSAEAEVADAKKAAGERAVRAEVERIEEAEQGALNETMRLVYERDVLADPVALKKRMEKRGEEFLKDVEVELYARSGVLQYVLEAEKVVVGDRSDKGLYKVQLPGNKEGEVHEVEWTEQQLMAYVAMQRESGVVKRMREFQAKVAGTALAEAAKGADVHAELVNLRELPMRALARMERNGGRVDYAVMQDLAEDARERISGFVSAGMSFGDAAMQMSEVPGVTLGTLAGTADAFVQRIEELAGTAEGEVLGIKTVNDAQTHAFRVRSTVSAGQSVLLFNRGLANERELVEDLIESDVVAAVEGENATVSWQALEGLLRRVEGELMKHGGGRLFKKGVKANAQTITEAFSKLGQSYFLLNHGRYDMSAESHHSIEYVQKKLAEAQHLVALSHAWDAFAKSKEGKAYLKKEGASLEKLLSDAGASVAGLYDRARFEADAFYAVREAYEASVLPSPKLAEEVLGRYEAEQKELDHPEPEGVPEVVEASASITGEALTLEPAGAVDAESGAFVVPVGAEVVQDADDRGRGLVGGNYVLMEGGSVYGVAEVESIGLSADVPQFKKKDTAAGRVEADADGTTHELAGGWNENSAPIHVWRRVDGRLEVISGRHRLAHAKKNGVKYIAVRVYDEGAGFDARWAKLHDVEQNILDNTCNAVDVAYYFRHNPMPLGEAEARGLMPKTKQGEQTAASRMGLTVALQASENTFALLVNGKCTAEDAYMACVIATTEDGQQLALEAREGKAGKKNGWEYVTALVRGAEQMQPADGGGMLDLFGNDDSFRERSEKIARYVAAVRAGIKARLNVLQSAGRLNKKGAVSKELGVKVKTPRDTARLIARLAVLDAAYERLDPDLGIPARVDAWDGKSAVPTKLEELAGNSSFSLAGNLTPEMEEIKVAAVADGTFMKAPNGNPTMLTEHQWLQVRTKAFKGWFGDWERAAELTIASEDGNFAAAKEFVKGLAGQALVNEDSGIVAYVNSEQRKELTHQSKARISQGNGFSVNGHFAVVMRINKLFRNAVRCGVYPDLKHGDPNVRIHRFACPIVIDGESAIAWMTAKETVNQKDSGRLYNLELLEINKLAGKVEDLEEHNLLLPPAASKDIVARLKALSKTYFEDYSKVVDENGEPRVMYHGSPTAGIREFEMHKALYGEGAFFTSSPEEALSYTGLDEDEFEDWDEFDAAATDSGLMYEVFLNIRDEERFYERNGGALHARAVAANEIKSATDNRGTFDGSNADITFSMAEVRNLAAVHSIPVDTMLDVEKQLGGLPKPSIAITRLDKPYSWGHAERVYLIGRPDLADPQQGNLVYDRDAWTGKGPFLLEGGSAYDYRKGEYFEPSLEEFVARTIKKKGQEDGSSFRGQSAVAIGTLDAVKAHREKLGDTDTSNAQKAETDAVLEELIANVVKLSKKGLNEDEVAMIMARVCWRSSPMNHGAPSEMKTGRDTAKRILNELGVRVKDIKKPLVDMFLKAVDGLKNELEDYLESVPQRAVMFNEFEYAVMPESMKDTPGLVEMLERNGITPIWHDGTEEGRKAALAGLVNDSRVSFSVIGPKAATWDKYADRAFKGRDDGMLRAEIDASQARLKSMAVSGNAGDEYRQLVAGKEMTFETEAALDKLREQQRLIEEAESFLLERDDIEGCMAFEAEHGMDNEWWAANTELREKVKAVVKSRLLDAGVTGEGKFGGLVKSYSRLMGLIMKSLLEGKVNEDVASELDAMSRYRDMTLSDALDYPELYKAYPDLKWLPVSVENLGARTAGRLVCMGDYPAEIRVNEMLNADEMRSTLLHEIQHAIQSIEEFAKGGNADSARELLERQIRQYRIRLEHLRHEQRWLYAVDTAKDHLQRMVRVLKRPRAILKMGERFAVREMQHVETMAAQAIEMMWNEYREMSIRDYGDSVAYAPGEGYKLPGRGCEVPTLAAVEKLLEKVKSLPSRRAGKLRGRRQKVEADIKRLYEENRAKLDMDGMVAHELYLRLAGEIEARNVQTRRDWTMDERLARLFNETLEYPGEALVTFSMAAVTAEWADTLERFRVMPPKAGTVPYRKDLYVCPTPAVMQMVGAKGWDIVMAPRVVVKCLHADTVLGNGMKLMEYYAGQEHWHDIALDVMKQLPAALADPICITVSDTPGCIEVVTELKEGNDNILVAVQLDSKKEGARTQSVNRIVSLYGKEKIEALLEHPRLYWNNAKARFWTGGKGLQLPVAPYPKRASARRVLTPADLVKYKMQTGLSFSLSGPDMVNVADTGRMAGEDKMQRLLKHAHKEAARWMRTFGKEVPAAKAAELMGSVSSIMGAIYKELPPKYRPRLEGHMRWVEVYARLLESGKVRAYGKLSKEQRAAVEAELLEALRADKERAEAEYERVKKEALDAAELTGEMVALEAATEMDVADEVKRRTYLDRLAKRTMNETRKRLLAEAEAKKKQLDAEIAGLTRDFAAEKLAGVAKRMLNEAANAVEQYLIDEELGMVEYLQERLAPRKLPNGKYDKGRMSADAYRRFLLYVNMMGAGEADVAIIMERLGQDIAAEEAKSEDEREDNGGKLDALQEELAEWSVYGALRSKNLDAVRKGVAALRDFAVHEKNAWQGVLQLQRNRAKRVALRAAEALGGADEYKVKDAVEKDNRLFRMLANLNASLQSLGQIFYGLGRVPELRGLVDESLDALSQGHVSLTLREKRAYNQLAKYMEGMGLKTEKQRNDWMAALKKKHKTEIYREGDLVRHRLKLTPVEAAEWLEMSKAERDAKRAELEAGADKQGVLMENVPYEEDIPLLREALAEFNAKPAGKKWVKTLREFRKDAPKEPLALSKDEALNILLLCEQQDYIDAAHDNGYTDAVLEELGRFVGADVLGFGYAMREILENNGLAEVYEAREGVPFPAVKNYWPGNFDQSARANEQANALDPTSGNGTRYGMLITRVKHKLKFNLLGASNVFMAALSQQNNYIVMGELTAKWRRLLSHNDFAMSLKSYLGDTRFKKFKELINLLDGAGVQESITQQTLSGLMSMFQSAHAMAVLAGSPITIVKQVSAALNAGAWEGVSVLRVAARVIADRLPGVDVAIRYADMLKKDYFQARYKDNRYFTEMMQLGRDANWSMLSSWARKGMGWIEKMDVLTNCASMTALYNIKYHDLKRLNEGAADPLTEEEIHAECDRVVRNALDVGAQPLRRTQKSAFGSLGRNAVVKSMCYMSSEALNKVGMCIAIGRRKGGWKGFLQAWGYIAQLSLAQQIVVMLLDMARNADPIDDDEWAEWALLNLATGASGLGIMQSIPMLGEAVQYFSKGYVKTGSLGQMIFDYEGAGRALKNLWDLALFDTEESVQLKKTRKSDYWQVTYKKFDGSRVTVSTGVPVDGGLFNGIELSKEEAELKALEVGNQIAAEDAPSWADWGLYGGNVLRLGTAFTGAWKGINATSKTMSELSGLLQSLNAMVNTVRPFMQAERNEVKQEKAFRKKVEKGWTEARKKTRARMKEKREKEKAEEKAKKKQEEILKRL